MDNDQSTKHTAKPTETEIFELWVSVSEHHAGVLDLLKDANGRYLLEEMNAE